MLLEAASESSIRWVILCTVDAFVAISPDPTSLWFCATSLDCFLSLSCSALLISSMNLDPKIIVSAGSSFLFTGSKVPFYNNPLSYLCLSVLNPYVSPFLSFVLDRNIRTAYYSSISSLWAGLMSFITFLPSFRTSTSVWSTDPVHCLTLDDRNMRRPFLVCTDTVLPWYIWRESVLPISW